jgi:hypothetical protein
VSNDSTFDASHLQRKSSMSLGWCSQHTCPEMGVYPSFTAILNWKMMIH